jgi:hypothetical protein
MRFEKAIQILLAAFLLSSLTIVAAPETVLGGDLARAAACSANLRTRPYASATRRTTIKTDTRVTVVAGVSGSAWKVTCAGKTYSGTHWYRISAINGKSVKSLYGVTYLYSAVGLFKAIPTSTPTPRPGGVVRTFGPTVSWSTFLAAARDMSIDVIELKAGTYRPWRLPSLSVNRAARPLTIRPAPGAAVVFSAQNDGAYGNPAFLVNGSSYITWDGSGGSMTFQHYLLANQGVFDLSNSNHITIRHINFRNIAGNARTTEQSSHLFYLNGGNHDILIEDIDARYFTEPGMVYHSNGLQLYTGGHGAAIYNVTARRVTIDGANWATVVRNGSHGLVYANWTVTNSGAHVPDAMDFGTDNTGMVTSVRTSASVSSPVRMGEMTDGGGNFWH